MTDAATNLDQLFTRQGAAHRCRIGRDDKGRPYFTQARTCGRCGGAGGSAKWYRTGEVCFDCNGSGTRGTETVKLYTAAELDRLNATAAKRHAKRVAAAEVAAAKAQAEADARRADFETLHGALLAEATRFAERSEFIADVVTKARARASMTEPQADALRAAVERIKARDAQIAASRHVGTVGARIEVAVTVERIGSYERSMFAASWEFETVWITTLRTDDGCAVVVKSPRFKPAQGARGTLRATVKEHANYKGEAQTVVQRPAFKPAEG